MDYILKENIYSLYSDRIENNAFNRIQLLRACFLLPLPSNSSCLRSHYCCCIVAYFVVVAQQRAFIPQYIHTY
jgi:hypothetical protein